LQVRSEPSAVFHFRLLNDAGQVALRAGRVALR